MAIATWWVGEIFDAIFPCIDICDHISLGDIFDALIEFHTRHGIKAHEIQR